MNGHSVVEFDHCCQLEGCCSFHDDDEFWDYFVPILVVLCLGCCCCGCVYCFRDAKAKKQIHAVVIQQTQMLEQQQRTMMQTQMEITRRLQQQMGGGMPIVQQQQQPVVVVAQPVAAQAYAVGARSAEWPAVGAAQQQHPAAISS